MDQKIHYLISKNRAIFLLCLLTLSALSVDYIRIKSLPFWLKKSRSTHNAYSKLPKIYLNHSQGYLEPTKSKLVIHSRLVPSFFYQWRARFLKAATATDSKGLVRGIFLGEDQPITDPIREKFKDTGLYHLLAASGYNCWIVSLFFIFLARVLFFGIQTRISTLTGLRLKKWLSPCFQVLGAWIFWSWSDQSPPINRAAYLISLKFLLRYLNLQSSFQRVLIILYLLSLLIQPRLWTSASFQLTYGCLFGILWVPRCLEPLKEKFNFVQNHKFWNTLWNYFAINLGACIGTIPTTYLMFESINFTSLFTNWLAVPIVSFGIMPCALLAMMGLALFETHNPMIQFLLSSANQFAELLYFLIDQYCKFGLILKFQF